MSRIKEIRDRLGMTQGEFAGAIGCTQGNIGHYERGQQLIPPQRAERLIDVSAGHGLRLTLDIVYGRDPMPEARPTQDEAGARPAETHVDSGHRRRVTDRVPAVGGA